MSDKVPHCPKCGGEYEPAEIKYYSNIGMYNFICNQCKDDVQDNIVECMHVHCDKVMRWGDSFDACGADLCQECHDNSFWKTKCCGMKEREEYMLKRPKCKECGKIKCGTHESLCCGCYSDKTENC